MSGSDILIHCLLVGTVLFGLYARTGSARVLMPEFIGKFYTYCIFHAPFFTIIALVLFHEIGLNDAGSGTALLEFLICAISSGAAWYFWAFDRFDPLDTDRLPIGVRIWALFSRRALARRHDGLVDTDTIVQRAKRAPGHAISAAKAKAETHRAKADAYELALAKQHQEAQAELARTAREYNDAKLRADEAKRRRDKRGRV